MLLRWFHVTIVAPIALILSWFCSRQAVRFRTREVAAVLKSSFGGDSYGLSGFCFVGQAVRVRTRGTCSCCADLVVILFLGSQYDFVLEKSSLGGCSYVLSGFCFASQPDRQHEVVLSRVAAVYHDFLFVWQNEFVLARVATVRGLVYVFALQDEFSFESYLRGFVPLAGRTFC